MDIRQMDKASIRMRSGENLNGHITLSKLLKPILKLSTIYH